MTIAKFDEFFSLFFCYNHFYITSLFFNDFFTFLYYFLTRVEASYTKYMVPLQRYGCLNG